MNEGVELPSAPDCAPWLHSRDHTMKRIVVADTVGPMADVAIAIGHSWHQGSRESAMGTLISFPKVALRIPITDDGKALLSGGHEELLVS